MLAASTSVFTAVQRPLIQASPLVLMPWEHPRLRNLECKGSAGGRTAPYWEEVTETVRLSRRGRRGVRCRRGYVAGQSVAVTVASNGAALISSRSPLVTLKRKTPITR